MQQPSFTPYGHAASQQHRDVGIYACAQVHIIIHTPKKKQEVWAKYFAAKRANAQRLPCDLCLDDHVYVVVNVRPTLSSAVYIIRLNGWLPSFSSPA